MERHVDVVVLSWNRLQETKACIQSVLEQQGVRVDLWVVDQGSRTDCLEALQAYCEPNSGIHLIELGENLGVPRGRNVGMKSGSASVIICLDNWSVRAT